MEPYKLTKPSIQLTNEEIEKIARRHETMTFEELIEEYIENTKRMIGEEVMEYAYPPQPFKQTGPPWDHQLTLDEKTIQLYADQTGEDNPLFTDPEYAAKTRYGGLIAIPTFLAIIRYPTAHGFGSWQNSWETGQTPRDGLGYPLAQFISGNAWEFYDVLRVGTRFRHSKTLKEFFEKQGSRGRLLFLITECCYWNTHGDLLGKAYCTQINLPRKARYDPTKIEEQRYYDRPFYRYSKDEIEKIVNNMENEYRRGAEILYWEDVEVGNTLPPIVMPPWTGQDIGSYRMLARNYELTFEQTYKLHYTRTETHPLTRWPYTFGAEHEDAVLCKYRGLPAPFDLGVQRFQIPARLLTNWMGDDGFLRKMYTALRKPVFWGDTTWYSGEVVKKYKVKEKGGDDSGGVPGEAEYGAVGIKIAGVNQIGEMCTPGTATVYLPSRELGPVTLPIPHPLKPPYVPFEVHRKDWY